MPHFLASNLSSVIAQAGLVPGKINTLLHSYGYLCNVTGDPRGVLDKEAYEKFCIQLFWWLKPNWISLPLFCYCACCWIGNYQYRTHLNKQMYFIYNPINRMSLPMKYVHSKHNKAFKQPENISKNINQ